jgi:hypothetical protein
MVPKLKQVFIFDLRDPRNDRDKAGKTGGPTPSEEDDCCCRKFLDW